MFKVLLSLLLLPMLAWGVEFGVASYNVENLFDEVQNGTEYEDYTPGLHNWTPRMVEIKLEHTAEVLCDLNSEIVALQEIENEYILKRLLKKLGQVGCGYKYYAITEEKSQSIHGAILSQYPLSNKREVQVTYSAGDRNILEVTAAVEGKPLTIFANHWKSKSNAGTESRRIKYAAALAKRIGELPQGREYIILGDLNSHYDEYQMLNKRLDDTGGRTGINHILGTIKDGQMRTEEEMGAAGASGHYNLWLELAPAKRWSHNFFGRKGAIDHILLPSSMFDGRGIDYLNNSFSVFKRAYLFTKEGYTNRWEYSDAMHKGKGYSDHFPVTARLSTQPYVAEKREIPTAQTIENLYKTEILEHPAKLEGCSVILKRGNNAIIKQSPKGMAIFIYGAAKELKEGERYDLTISELGNYNGLKEALRIESAKQIETLPLDGYYLRSWDLKEQDPNLQNQVFVDLEGLYRNEKLEIGGEEIPIHFKRKKFKPQEGVRLKIFFAHLGYYKKRAQLVLYDQSDFEVVE